MFVNNIYKKFLINCFIMVIIFIIFNIFGYFCITFYTNFQFSLAIYIYNHFYIYVSCLVYSVKWDENGNLYGIFLFYDNF
ncbi:hypothetical protein MmiAt1_09640 [Methanimicrococcus sp. At1]|uniref:Uncharacterized protein n=1 Tax=Methanimicrococcus hacksteinii TaxID=3028293 RepID=A0ABU3VPN8_9EURY|nr:hypothetical protein [Methanimicrococcus sp. At1]